MSTEEAVIEAPGSTQEHSASPADLYSKYFPNDPDAKTLAETFKPEGGTEQQAGSEQISQSNADASQSGSQDASADSSKSDNGIEVDADLPEALRPKSSGSPVVDITDIDKGKEVVKSMYGIDLGSPDGFKSLTDKLQSFTDVEKQATEYKSKFEGLNSELSKLSDVTKAVVLAELEGRNPQEAYEAAVGKRIDFTLSEDKVPMETLIRVYASDIITEEEYKTIKADEPNDKLVKSAEQVALAKFREQKAVNQKTLDENLRRESDKQTKYANSLQASVSEAMKAIPNPDAPEFKAVVEKVSESGLAPLFYNNDNTLRPDAIERVFYAENGSKIVKQLMEANNKLKAGLKAKSEELASAVGAMPEKVPETPFDSGAEGKDEMPSWLKAIGSK